MLHLKRLLYNIHNLKDNRATEQKKLLNFLRDFLKLKKYFSELAPRLELSPRLELTPRIGSNNQNIKKELLSSYIFFTLCKVLLKVQQLGLMLYTECLASFRFYLGPSSRF